MYHIINYLFILLFINKQSILITMHHGAIIYEIMNIKTSIIADVLSHLWLVITFYIQHHVFVVEEQRDSERLTSYCWTPTKVAVV